MMVKHTSKKLKFEKKLEFVKGTKNEGGRRQGSRCTWKTWKKRPDLENLEKIGVLGAKTYKNIVKPGKNIWPNLKKAQKPQQK